MKTIGNQCHRICHITHDDLDEKEERRQPHHREQAAFFPRIFGHLGETVKENKKNEKLKQNRCTGKSSYTELFPNGLKSALIDWKTTNKKEIKLENNFSYA